MTDSTRTLDGVGFDVPRDRFDSVRSYVGFLAAPNDVCEWLCLHVALRTAFAF